MIRILIFLLVILLLAGTITFFAALDSRIAGEAFGYKFDAPSGIVVGALAIAFLLAIYVTHKIKDIIDFPKKLKAREAEARRSRGVAALTRGLEAVAVGDATDASHHAKVAERHLDDLALTRLLSAQAAQLSGDNSAAKQSFTAMLGAPETEFLGLKGLFNEAMAAGDKAKAREFAERAFKLRANAKWAFQSVVDLALAAGDWGAARDAITKARKNKLIENIAADRGEAALLTAGAYAAAASDDQKTAISDAEAALKLAPDFAPAVCLAARGHGDEGKTGRAAKLIESAFTLNSHPAYVSILNDLYRDEKPERAAPKLRQVAEKNRESLEAHLLKAKADILEGNFDNAVDHIEAGLEAAPSPAAYRLMAEAAAGLGGEAKIWLEHAALAPRDPTPGADGDFNFTREGWARLIAEYMHHGRLAPPPLQEFKPAISKEEIRLLIAPAPVEIAVVHETDEELENSSGITADEPPASDDKTPPADQKGDLNQRDDEPADEQADAERAVDAARGVS
ncbi:MAG: tetratricopeptide repeat protein [Marinicaulis sp.]|nr:tetratricopeptide repeat protein [Marinicaulis sp.]